MNDRNLLKYLIYFSEKKVDLSDEKGKEEIDKIFGWQVFLKNLQILEDDSLIIENNDRNSYSLTEKGKINLTEIKNEIDFENSKQNAELESLKTSTEVNKFLLRTKWLPHIVALVSLIFSIYTYFDAQNDSKKLEERIHKLEKKSETVLNKSKK
ncbi:hypothetical protein O8E88_002237 [Flavobacterium psychrophilum]|uniref:hypothetical protein n=1 Tax=Flavobacterium psychrophilum TaxID=96345 RepID=UPI0004F6B474|nr:hypothetical protein [Flavobacterium psychrophilum]AIN75164.1 hypothetical protein FPG3_07000 [Flavobacterium psychrophilum FPG3]EKT2070410.1 hypothetical protein [Flavobacterium psychrophilum]EKT2072884.1 hypothetical protein [Flavobacterium psychrophilum]EKT3964936.1 hypothetical protein [Flavobacterium psychrophilum]EKT4492299.1 hypothetical protein [Flavobacterium psychrophilum]